MSKPNNYVDVKSKFVLSVCFINTLTINISGLLYVLHCFNVNKQILKLEDRSQKKKIMFLHSKNKASRKGYKGEC